MIEKVRRVNQRFALVGNRARQTAMRVSQRGDADARQQVDVLPIVGIPQAHALAADERHRLASISLQYMARLAPNNVVDHHRHRVTASFINRVAFVGAALPAAPINAAVSLPSTITTSSTPPARACSDARSLAIIPAV